MEATLAADLEDKAVAMVVAELANGKDLHSKAMDPGQEDEERPLGAEPYPTFLHISFYFLCHNPHDVLIGFSSSLLLEVRMQAAIILS